VQQKSELDRIREEAEMKQRAILWPDMLRSGRTVDEFLWKGSPRATPIQRIGLALFGVLFLLCAALSTILIFRDTWAEKIIGGIIGSLSVIAGIRLMMNAFRHGARHRKSR
jgi:hypothetical protein